MAPPISSPSFDEAMRADAKKITPLRLHYYAMKEAARITRSID